MRILVLGGDGYLGWPTSVHLSACGHKVAVADNGARRRYDHEMGTASLVPIHSLSDRISAWRRASGHGIQCFEGDLLDREFLPEVIGSFRPDAVVHFAEQRSAPYSMIDREHAVYTQTNNVMGTLNLLYAIATAGGDAHLVKLGSMGEYGTPNIAIAEGWLEVQRNGRHDRMLYPKRPGSFYHLSKVHDSHNIEFACRNWGLRATDLNQGIVYGQGVPELSVDPRLATRFDYDAVFGTVLNRFVVQAALGLPLTVYGSGTQIRGVIDMRDTVECIRLACENPADSGEFRVFNQMTESFSINELADAVASRGPGETKIEWMENPRVEQENHFYEVEHSGLTGLGLRPHLLSPELIDTMLSTAERWRDRVRAHCLSPTVRWTGTRSELPDGVDLTQGTRAAG